MADSECDAGDKFGQGVAVFKRGVFVASNDRAHHDRLYGWPLKRTLNSAFTVFAPQKEKQ